MPCDSDIVIYLQKIVVDELRGIYPEAVGLDAVSLPLTLADINEKTGERFVIIIDEWDTVFRDDKYNQKIQNEYINLLRGLFKGEKSQRFMMLAYLTGILPIKKYNMDFMEAQRWYDGYSFEGIQHIYSPNSVVKAMLRKKYSNYWTQTVAYELLKGWKSDNLYNLTVKIVGF